MINIDTLKSGDILKSLVTGTVAVVTGFNSWKGIELHDCDGRPFSIEQHNFSRWEETGMNIYSYSPSDIDRMNLLKAMQVESYNSNNQ